MEKKRRERGRNRRGQRRREEEAERRERGERGGQEDGRQKIGSKLGLVWLKTSPFRRLYLGLVYSEGAIQAIPDVLYLCFQRQLSAQNGMRGRECAARTCTSGRDSNRSNTIKLTHALTAAHNLTSTKNENKNHHVDTGLPENFVLLEVLPLLPSPPPE